MRVSAVRRQSRLRGSLGSSPLNRWTDRAEAWAIIVLAAIALCCGLSAIAGADRAYSESLQVIEQQNRTRHAVEATVSRDADIPVSRYMPTTTVPVYWMTGAVPHEANVNVSRNAKAGDKVEIWLDDAGAVVPKPVEMSTAAPRAGLQVVGDILFDAMICVGLFVALRFALDRHRTRQWTRELAFLLDSDDGRANRFN